MNYPRPQPFTLILTLAITLTLMLSACGSKDATQPAQQAPEQPAVVPAAIPSAEPATPIASANPELDRGVAGAWAVLAAWARALEQHDFDRAWALFGDQGAQSGMTSAEYGAQFAGYRDIVVAVSEGTIEGGAGSLYYEVTTTVTGTTLDGEPFRLHGTTYLRRVNDVDGASAEQLRWHLASSSLSPA